MEDVFYLHLAVGFQLFIPVRHRLFFLIQPCRHCNAACQSLLKRRPCYDSRNRRTRLALYFFRRFYSLLFLGSLFGCVFCLLFFLCRSLFFLFYRRTLLFLFLFRLRNTQILFIVLPRKHKILRLFSGMLIILLLLKRRKRLIFHLKLHCQIDILPLAEPENQIITFLYAFPDHTSLVIQLCQFICPLFNVLRLLKLLKRSNLLLKRRLLYFQYPVFQDILIRILRRQLNKLFITIGSLFRVIHFKRQCSKPVNDFPASRRTVKRHEQNIAALLELSAVFINLTNRIQHRRTLYPAPVNRIRNFHRFSKLLFLCIFKQLFCFYPIFIFIQIPHLNMYLSFALTVEIIIISVS